MLRSAARLGSSRHALYPFSYTSLCAQCSLRTFSSATPLLSKKKKSAAAVVGNQAKDGVTLDQYMADYMGTAESRLEAAMKTANTTTEDKASKKAKKNGGSVDAVKAKSRPRRAEKKASSLEQAMKRKTPSLGERLDADTKKVAKAKVDQPKEEIWLSAEERDVQVVTVENQPQVRGLQHGLDRVLFNPGVAVLQDPRSRVFNFDPDLQRVLPVTDFDFNTIATYLTSSKDPALEKVTREAGKKYMGSTSSMTSVLAQFHYLISKWRPINFDCLSRGFSEEGSDRRGNLGTYTNLSRSPAAIFLRYKGDGTYAIDADKEYDSVNVLSMMGHSMEKLLTTTKEEFLKHTTEHSHLMDPAKKGIPETYHYSTFGDFLMRSQLDARDDRLPGSGMFDLKSRAVAAIRTDISNFELGVGYQIKKRAGLWESFEREYYDLMRSAFLKYSLQVRMGAMDGIYVTYHNIMKIFGFQYISIDEMDMSIHGGPEIGHREFKLSLRMLNDLFNKATEKFPEQSLRIHVETRDTLEPTMYFFAEPMEEPEINKIQADEASQLQDFMVLLKQKLGINKDYKGVVEPIEATETEGTTTADTFDESEMDPAALAAAEAAFEGPDLGSVIPEDVTDDTREALVEETVAETVAETPFKLGDPMFKEEITIDEAERLPNLEETRIPSNPEDILSDSIATAGADADALTISEHALDIPAEVPAEEAAEVAPKPEEPAPTNLLALNITVSNLINGIACERPYDLAPGDEWKLKYSLTMDTNVKAATKYTSCKNRRKNVLDNNARSSTAVSPYHRNLRALSKQGEQWEKKQLAKDVGPPVQV